MRMAKCMSRMYSTRLTFNVPILLLFVGPIREVAKLC